MAAFLACAAAALAAETLDTVERQITQRQMALQSVQFKEHEVSDQVTEKGRVHGITESFQQYARVGGKVLVRVERTDRLEFRLNEGHRDTRVSEGFQVDDGKAMYVLIEDGKEKTVFTQPHVEGTPLGGQPPFALIRKMGALELLPDEVVDGREAWVIRIKPRQTPAEGKRLFDVRCMWFDKQTGVVIKNIIYGPNGRVDSTSHVTDLVVNPEIQPARFHFEIPPGAKVIGKEQIDAAATRAAEEMRKEEARQGHQQGADQRR